MDVLQHSVLQVWYKSMQGEDEDRSAKERTSFNIISAFALEDGTLDFDLEKITQLSEESLDWHFPRDKAGNIDLPPLHETEQWHQRLAETGLLASKPRDTTATLNIIYVHQEDDSITGMSSNTLLSLFDVFGLDHSFLHLLSRKTDTWHCIRRDNGTCTFLFTMQGIYGMACSFSTPGRETNCMIFGRAPNEVSYRLEAINFNFYQPAWFRTPHTDGNLPMLNRRAALDEKTIFDPPRAFSKLLSRIKCYHLHHPLSLAYLGLTDSLASMFIRSGEEIHTISDLEDSIKPFPAAEASPNDIRGLSILSGRAGGAMVTMARLSKVTGVATMVLQALEDRDQWESWYRLHIPTERESRYESAATWMAGGLPSCRQILENEKLQISSQENRLKALTPMIIAQISRASAGNGSKLAESSNNLAKSTQEDKQSLKTIAAMTVAFVPATIIAAMLAAP